MAYPKAYEPRYGYKYQLLCRNNIEWEHCDYAKDKTEKDYLLNEYRLAYNGFEIKSFRLPRKYWG